METAVSCRVYARTLKVISISMDIRSSETPVDPPLCLPVAPPLGPAVAQLLLIAATKSIGEGT